MKPLNLVFVFIHNSYEKIVSLPSLNYFQNRNPNQPFHSNNTTQTASQARPLKALTEGVLMLIYNLKQITSHIWEVMIVWQ